VIVDYHLHLRDSGEQIAHSADAVERYVETARARGVDEIGFTEHVYYFRQTLPLWTQPYQTERCVYDLDEYVEAVLEAKRRGLPVKLGLEVDYVGERQEELAELLEPYPWDYLLGSVHWIDGHSVDSAPDRGIWAEAAVDEVWRRYFAALAELASSGDVDVLAHPDLAKIFGLRPKGRIEYPTLRGVALEISTNGRYKPVGELYPDRELLQEAGLPITLASDAHVPANVGRDFDLAIELAREAGYETVTVFEGRRARQEPLG
jgi:histidinol-phosphatase (PHP family)